MAALLFAGIVNGATYIGDTEYSAGAGASTATMVVDFDQNNYFIFEYSWDGDAVLWDAVDALVTADVLAIEFMSFDPPYEHYITDFIYEGGVKFDYVTEFGTNPYDMGWVNYVSADNGTWGGGGAVDLLDIEDGQWYSWVWTNSAPYGSPDWGMPYRGPGEAASVPEPGMLALMGLGGFLLRRKKA